MMYKELTVQTKWFDEATPTNPHKASATLTFTGAVSDGEIIEIGTEVYEFKTSGNAGEGKIKVDVSDAQTADAAIGALVDTINTNSIIVTAVGNTTEDTVVVEYNDIGTEGNSIAVDTDCVNASWGEEVATLSGGSYGTPSMVDDVVVYATPYYYWCEKAGSKYTVSWKRFTPVTY